MIQQAKLQGEVTGITLFRTIDHPKLKMRQTIAAVDNTDLTILTETEIQIYHA